MNLITEQLKTDHKQLVRVLYHLEREVKAYSGLSGSCEASSAHMATILDILDYIQCYPEIWHHPTEDLILETLLEKGMQEADALAEVMEEHVVLELLTENLHDYINQLASGKCQEPAKVKARFIKSTGDYISRQLSHMEQEQKLLFPLVEEYVEQADWEKLKQQMKDLHPLLDAPQVQHYQSRYKEIASGSPVTSH